MIFDMTKRVGGGGGGTGDYTAADFFEDAKPTGDLISDSGLRQYRFYYRTGITSVHLTTAAAISTYGFDHCSNLQTFVARAGTSIAAYALGNCPKLRAVDVTSDGALATDFCRSSYTLGTPQVFIFRGDTLKPASSNFFRGSGVMNGVATTIYINKSVYDHLEDGGDLDYAAAANWSSIYTRSNVTFAKIEGSIYETQYVDGTPIPTT